MKPVLSGVETFEGRQGNQLLVNDATSPALPVFGWFARTKQVDPEVPRSEVDGSDGTSEV